MITEIKNDLVICANNHYFNATVHNVCPICGSPAAAVRMAGGFVPTEKPDISRIPAGGMGSFVPTEAPQGAAAARAPGVPLSVTAPADP